MKIKYAGKEAIPFIKKVFDKLPHMDNVPKGYIGLVRIIKNANDK